MWLGCDSPRRGAVADCMRHTRAVYHYAIRRVIGVKRDEELIVRDRIATSILSDDGRDFGAEIKRILSNKASCSKTIDGLTDVESIAKLFAGKYKELYTSVPYDKSELQDVINGLNLSMSDSCVTSDHKLKIKEIKHAVSKLKPHNGEYSSALTSDHVVNAGDDLIYVSYCVLIHIICCTWH